MFGLRRFFLYTHFPRFCSWSLRLIRCVRLSAIWKPVSYYGARSKRVMLTAVTPVAVMYASSKDVPAIIKHADRLYEDNKMQQLYDYMMEFKDVQVAEIQWRCSRACYKLSILPTTDKNEAKQLAHACLAFAKQAVELDNNNFQCHKWIGIAYSTVGDHEGTKTKIQHAYKVKDHFERAIQLNPRDSTVRHLLGRWCYAICDVSWVQRQIASAIFATPPSSSYEEALRNFEQAEQSRTILQGAIMNAFIISSSSDDPGFYSANWLYLGKVYLKLGQGDKACNWLQKAANYDPNNQEDVEAKREAEELLKRL